MKLNCDPIDRMVNINAQYFTINDPLDRVTN